VSTLERRIPRGGLKFGAYLAYADYLGLTFEELFNTVLAPEEEGYHQFLSREQRSHQRETDLLNRIRQAVDHIHEQGTHINQARVSRAIDIPRPSLQPFPRIRAVLAQIKQESRQETLLHNQQLDQELVEKVNLAITSLRAEGKPATQTAIGRLLNRHRQGFRRYPRVRAVMSAVSQAYRQKAQQQMEESLQEMIANVQRSIAELKSRGEPVTKLAVGNMLGVSRGLMNYHPELRMIFAQCADWKERPGRKGRQ